ncbi:hypothetical protein TRFO_18055 [Tritrichomonas foetus]|uniref:Ubiquitin-like domain-containing protein n=1 Tax=Tritrichomonas foetus TaxID=1144522 RepID=A0A1J4KMX4_9EUKA|nr:hypothetical protein TRFO_18055 [Tritrichomonas foetus]|eukprot:OHT12248.1 hypothetical protein TRFO_18055 [Tritrichomonas foetus]
MSSKERMWVMIKVIKPENKLALEVTEDDTVIDLKYAIDQKIRVHPRFQYIVFKGAILQDSTILTRHGILHGSKIFLYYNTKKMQNSESCELLNDDGSASSYGSRIRSSSCSSIMQPNFDCIDNSQLHMIQTANYIRQNLSTLSASTDLSDLYKDAFFNRIEFSASGFRAQVNHFHHVDHFLNTRFDESVRQMYPFNMKTVIPPPPEVPSTDPLPTPYLSSTPASAFQG